MEHVLVWERHHGAVPEGHCVHHINGDKLDNRIENLEAVSLTAHKRLHGGCEIRGGVWWKPCRKCGTMKPIAEYYERSDGVSSWCRQCCIGNATENRRRRKQQRLLEDS